MHVEEVDIGVVDLIFMMIGHVFEMKFWLKFVLEEMRSMQVMA